MENGTKRPHNDGRFAPIAVRRGAPMAHEARDTRATESSCHFGNDQAERNRAERNDAEKERERPAYRKLKQMRDLFSLSENGFRYYENAGLVNTPRNEKNDYRVATLSSAVMMCNAFTLTHYGIVMRDVRSMLVEDDASQVMQDMQSASERLGREAMELLQKKAHLDHEISSLADFVADAATCSVTRDEDLWFVSVHRQSMDLSESYEDARCWWRGAPFVNAALYVETDERGDASDVLHGPLCSGVDAARLELPLSRAIHFCKIGKPYVRAFTSFRADEMPTHENYAHACEFARKNGLRLDASHVLHRLIRYHEETGSPMRDDEIFIPIVEGAATGSDEDDAD